MNERGSERSKYRRPVIIGLAAVFIIMLGGFLMWQRITEGSGKGEIRKEKIVIPLPEPTLEGETSVEEALVERRSIREYQDQPITLAEASQLLWAAQGVTGPRGQKRTAPSAGALYPLELFLVAGEVDGLDPGLYRYHPDGHELGLVRRGDLRREISLAALEQESLEDGAAILVFAAVYERTGQRYGDRGHRYVHMEVGHAAQNVYLEATALDLGTVIIGAFLDDALKIVLGLRADEEPLALMPVGRPVD
jgi:SagB-type dehydrogenase family enzyme